MGTVSFGNGWEGRVVEGRFPLLERLESSGNSVSFLTVLQGLQEAVIHLISTDAAEADKYIAQWEFAKTLSHPHLTRIFAVGRCTIDQIDLVYVATERPYATLAKTIQTRALKADSARETFDPILKALAYLHENRIVHGHVDPSTIEFAEMKPKLSVTDLLIAGTVKRSISQHGGYDAPELTRGAMSAACDTWSVGMTLCEAMTQILPTMDPSGHTEPEIPKSLPGPFREIVQDCLRIDPMRRLTIETLQERLEESKAIPVSDEAIPAKVDSPVPPISTKPAVETRIPEERAAPPPTRKKIETQEPPEPVLFSKSLTHFGEPRGGPFRIVVYAFLLLAVMALVSYLLIRAGKIRIPGPIANPGAPAVSAPAPEKKAETSTPPTENPTAPPPGSPASEKQPGAAPPSVENQSAPQSNPPAPQPQPEAAPATEARKPAAPQPKAPVPAKEQATPATSPAAKPPKARGNTEGLVEKRVIPNVSPGALAGMRRPVEVLIRVSVNRDGTVSNASYVSPGPGNYFARQAQRAALSWRFTPPTRSGAAGRSVWMLRFNFGRGNTEAEATIETK